MPDFLPRVWGFLGGLQAVGGQPHTEAYYINTHYVQMFWVYNNNALVCLLRTALNVDAVSRKNHV